MICSQCSKRAIFTCRRADGDNAGGEPKAFCEEHLKEQMVEYDLVGIKPAKWENDPPPPPPPIGFI